MDLSIVIVNWNSENDVRKCLISVYANTKDIQFEVIVVDGASFDGCGQMLAREFPQVRFIQSNENVGFGKANNLGVRSAVGEYLLLLNPDTEVLGSAVQTMLGVMRTSRQAGCATCRLLNTDRSLQTSCIQSFPSILNQLFDSDYLRGLFPQAKLWGVAPLYGPADLALEVEAVAGACVIIKREVFNAVGGFSPEYFMYAEDMDLSHKTHAGGWKNYYLPQASIVHHGDGSVRKARSDFAVIMAVDSLTIYFRKFHGRTYAWTYRLAITASAIIRLTLLAPVLLLQKVRARETSLIHSWKKWMAILRWGTGIERWQVKFR